MKLHNNRGDFQELIAVTAAEKHIPESAVERDYFIVRALLFLSRSEYAKKCVFKGGTSLSKCFPGSIERFSEDIDLTFIPDDGLTNKQIERRLKAIEKLMTADAETEIIPSERNSRNKSIYFWNNRRDSKIKLEIGSSVRPEPYSAKTLKTYIQEYLEGHGFSDVIHEFELTPVTINVLDIERTFVDKLMAVKRHVLCNNIAAKSRHIYDVSRLFNMPEIQAFLHNQTALKRIVTLTKQTDSVYLEKRNIPKDYNPIGSFAFPTWETEFMQAKNSYERLHEELLYTDKKQHFDAAVTVFREINAILESVGE